MKGATVDPCPKTISIPKRPRIKKIGNSQYFFLSFKKSRNSFIKISILVCKTFNCYNQEKLV
jgi:hypothetical protein